MPLTRYSVLVQNAAGQSLHISVSARTQESACTAAMRQLRKAGENVRDWLPIRADEKHTY